LKPSEHTSIPATPQRDESSLISGTSTLILRLQQHTCHAA
jgi:hypothetical protein